MRTRLTVILGDPRGSFLVSALMVVFIATALGVALFEVSVVDNRLILGTDCDARALYAAEAGLQVAYRDLANGTGIGTVDFDGVKGNTSYATRTNLTGHVNQPLSGSGAQLTTFTVQAQVVGSTIRLWSTGSATNGCPGGPASATVRQDVGKITTPGGGGHSFVGQNHILTGGAGFMLDSFDSSKGPYDCLGGSAGCTVANGTRNKCQQTTAPFTCNIEIWTNGPDRTTLDGGPIYGNLVAASGEVKLKTAPTIYGAITYDSGDGSFTGNPGQVIGGVTAQSGISPIVLPNVPDPDGNIGTDHWDCRRDNPTGGFYSRVNGSWVTTAAALSTVITAGTYSYSASTGAFTASSNLTLNPGANSASLCFSDFSMAGRSLSIPSGVSQPVQIYVGSACPASGCGSRVDQGSTIGQALLSGDVVNSTGRSQYLRVYSISNKGNDDVWVTSGTGSYVFAYAPRGQVQVKGGGAFFGAAFGDQLEANGGSQLHFDNALLSVPGLPGLTAGGGGTSITYTLGTWKQCRDSACT